MGKFIAVTGVAGLNKDDVIDFIVSNFKDITHIKYFDDLYFENNIPTTRTEKEGYLESNCDGVRQSIFSEKIIQSLKKENVKAIGLVNERTKENLYAEEGIVIAELVIKPKSTEEFNRWINNKVGIMGAITSKFLYDKEEENASSNKIIVERQHDQLLSDNEKEEIRKLIGPYLS